MMICYYKFQPTWHAPRWFFHLDFQSKNVQTYKGFLSIRSKSYIIYLRFIRRGNDYLKLKYYLDKQILSRWKKP